MSNSPYWKRPQYKALTAKKWDIIIIMLGTNDAKDPGDKGPNNWLHNCGGPDHTSLDGCTFAEDYASMIKTVNAQAGALGDAAVERKFGRDTVRDGALVLDAVREAGDPEKWVDRQLRLWQNQR